MGVALYFSPVFREYRFSKEHPISPLRLELLVDLLESLDMIQPEEILPPRMAKDEELALFHDPRYIAMLDRVGEKGRPVEGALTFGLGTRDNPINFGIHEAARYVAGASVEAVRRVMEGQGEHAMNPAGGMHHGRKSRAFGFCFYNDVAVAIAYLRKVYKARVAYIDTDAHHGDGVQEAFYDDPDVLTISIHESGKYLFPHSGFGEERGHGAGFGYNVNLPLEAYTEDDSWMEVFRGAVPPLLQVFQPDIIVSQHGCDAHILDSLSHLSLTMGPYKEIPAILHGLAHELCDGRWVALGGGGYDPFRVLPRAWAFLWAELAGRKLPERIPEAWREKWGPLSCFALPENFMDRREDYPQEVRHPEAAEINQCSCRRIVEQALYQMQKFL